jgi:trimethylamine:corrinoid methyltransferase-like protein
MQWLLAAPAGINLIWGAGMIENHTIWSDKQLIVDAEICERVGRYLDGIDTGSGSSNFKTIKEVGHFSGNYLMQPQTLQDLPKEHYIPTISSQHDYDS